MYSFRTIAIGDVHGCSKALATLINRIDPSLTDTIVTLGDYVDRGIDSKGVDEEPYTSMAIIERICARTALHRENRSHGTYAAVRRS